MKSVLFLLLLTISIGFNCSSQHKDDFIIKNTYECSCKKSDVTKTIQIFSDSLNYKGVIYYKFIIFGVDTVNIGISVRDDIITIKSPNYYLSDTLLNLSESSKENINDDFKPFLYYYKNSGNKIFLFGGSIHGVTFEGDSIKIVFDFTTSHSQGIGKIKLNNELKLMEFWYYDGNTNYWCK